MAVFPEAMNRLNLEDAAGSLRQVESYIQYMRERLEFSMKHASGGGASVMSIEEKNQLISDMSRLQSAVNNLSATVGGLLEIMRINDNGELEIDGKTKLHIDCGVWE